MNYQSITAIKPLAQTRLTTGFWGFDNLLGGGLIDGECLLFAGSPGVGKSTLLTQLCYNLAIGGQKSLYISGEESLSQMRLRADRLGAVHVNFFCSQTTILEEIIEMLKKIKPKFLVVDSLQTVTTNTLKKPPGSNLQMLQCLKLLVNYVKDHNMILLIVGHATKAGLPAGLLTIQHEVDMTLFMTSSGEVRVGEAKKNRFGSVGAVWKVFMTPNGLQEKAYKKPLEINFLPFRGIVGIVANPIYWLVLLFAGALGNLVGMFHPLDNNR